MRVLHRRTWISGLVVAAILMAACSGAGAPEAISEHFTPSQIDAMTQDEVDTMMTDCLRSLGYNIVRDQFGELGVEPKGNSVQDDQQFLLDDANCKEVTGYAAYVQERISRSLTPEELAARYGEVAAAAACLEANNFVAGDPPPSLEAFQESSGANWDPYDGIENLPDEEFFRLLNECPQP